MSFGKRRPLLAINTPVAGDVGPALVETLDDYAPPAIPSVPAPDAPVLATALARSAVTPTALISATWTKPVGVEPQFYVIQWSTDSSFPDGQTSGQDAPQTSATIEGLKPATVYYVRVAAVYRAVQSPWSDATSIPTENDTTPPDPPGIPTWTWLDTGDLIVRSTEPTNSNYHWLEIKVWTDATKTTLLTTAYFVGGSYTWSLSENQRATGSSGDAAVYIELRSQSWTGFFSSAVVPAVQPNRPAPSAPTSLTTSWAGDTGTAGPDCTITCTAPAGAVRYVWTIDGNTIPSTVPRLVYSLDSNRAQHSGSPDSILSISVVAYDALGQASPTASTTATNAAPAAPTINIANGASQLVATVTSAPPADFQAYEYTWKVGSTTLTTIESASATNQYEASTTGTYTVVVRVKDAFGQYSPTATSSSVFLDPLTYAILAATATYTDSAGNSASTLAVLKDNTTASGGVAYGASASWQWVQVVRPLIDRYFVSTTVATAGIGYIATSADGVNWLFWSGPLAGDGRTLVLVSSTPQALGGANETTAQTNAVTLPTTSTGRLDLPQITEARYVRLGFKMTAGGTLREFYPRRYLQLDDLDAGIIRGMVISAGQFITNSLAALSANLGAVHIDGVCDIATTGGFFQGTGTFASPTTALKIYNSGGIGKLATYNTGVEQIVIDTDGKLKWGGGVGIMDAASGITIEVLTQTSNPGVSKYGVRWDVSGVNKAAIMAYNHSIGGGQLIISATGGTGGKITLQATSVLINGSGGLYVSGGDTILQDTYVQLGLNVGAVSGASTGQVKTASHVLCGGVFYPGGATDTYYGRWGSSTSYIVGNLVVSGAIYPSNQGSYALYFETSPYNRFHLNANTIIDGFIRTTGTSGWYHEDYGGGWYMQDSTWIRSYGSKWVYVGGGHLVVEGSGCGVVLGNSGGTNSSDRLRIYGHGTGSTTYGIVVKDSAGTNNMYIRDDGNSNYIRTAWTTVSDERKKDKITPIAGALARVRRLGPREYERRDLGRRRERGFVAHELAEIYPDIVETVWISEDEQASGVRYQDLIPELAAAIAEHVAIYEQTIAELRAEVVQLKKRR